MNQDDMQDDNPLEELDLDTRLGTKPAAEVAPPKETKINLQRCPCGEPPGQLRIEMAQRGSKTGSVRGSCCGEWAVEFINNTMDAKRSLEKASAAWNAAPRATMIAPALEGGS